jgi:hypothetical protein
VIGAFSGAQEDEMPDDDEREDALIEHVARVLCAPEPTAPRFTERIMALAHAPDEMAAQEVRSSKAVWWRRRRTVELSLSPLGALAIAVGIGMFAVVADIADRHSNAAVDRTTDARVAASDSHDATAAPDTVHVVRFVFFAPQASSVSMVGDFNNWNRTVTPLRRTGSGGAWTVSVSLPAGAHQYAFIVDGTSWTPDPASTTTVSDDFGTLTSVIAVGGAT